MSTLLLRLTAPLQAWGTDSNFETRRTEREPSKSGVIGLLASALGLRRDEDIGRLKELKFGVLVEREGKIIKDFHTAKSKLKKKEAFTTERYYLSDACFLVGFEHDDDSYLEELAHAVSHPAFPLFLGRRSCPPARPVLVGLRSADLRSALIADGLIESENARMLLDTTFGDAGAVLLNDAPLSFSQKRRQHSARPAKEEYIKTSEYKEPAQFDLYGETEHDAMKEL